MKDALLILFGAIISCGTTFFLDFIKCKREEKLYYRRKRETTYIEMQDFVTDLYAHWAELKAKYFNTDLRLKYNALRSKVHIYCKKEIVDCFYGITNDLIAGIQDENFQKRNDTLVDMIKEDLKIRG